MLAGHFSFHSLLRDNLPTAAFRAPLRQCLAYGLRDDPGENGVHDYLRALLKGIKLCHDDERCPLKFSVLVTLIVSPRGAHVGSWRIPLPIRPFPLLPLVVFQQCIPREQNYEQNHCNDDTGAVHDTSTCGRSFAVRSYRCPGQWVAANRELGFVIGVSD
jgi:hypothetical protein